MKCLYIHYFTFEKAPHPAESRLLMRGEDKPQLEQMEFIKAQSFNVMQWLREFPTGKVEFTWQ